jgi:uncharacterized lipoprotein YajG
MLAETRPLRAILMRLAVVLATLGLLAGCTTPAVLPTQTPSASPTPRPFTLLTTGPMTTADPRPRPPRPGTPTRCWSQACTRG